jgi:hypothetical protein
VSDGNAAHGSSASVMEMTKAIEHLKKSSSCLDEHLLKFGLSMKIFAPTQKVVGNKLRAK